MDNRIGCIMADWLRSEESVPVLGLDTWFEILKSPFNMRLDDDFYFKRRLIPYSGEMSCEHSSCLFTISGLGNAKSLFRHVIWNLNSLPQSLPACNQGLHIFLRRKVRAGSEKVGKATDRWWVYAGLNLCEEKDLNGRWGRLFADQVKGISYLSNENEEFVTTSWDSQIKLRYFESGLRNLDEKVRRAVKDTKEVQVFSFYTSLGKGGYRLCVLLTGYQNRFVLIAKGLEILDENPSINSISVLSTSDKRFRSFLGAVDYESLLESQYGCYMLLLEVCVFDGTWQETVLKKKF